MPTPASLGEGYGLLEVKPAGGSPRGAICQWGLVKHSLRRLQDFPTLQGLLERGWHRVLEVRKSQAPSGNCSCSTRAWSWSLGLVFGSALTASALLRPKGKWRAAQPHTCHSELLHHQDCPCSDSKPSPSHLGPPRRKLNIAVLV